MQDKTLLKLCILVAVLGIIGLWFLTSSIGVTEIKSISKTDVGKTFRIAGKITSYYTSDVGHVFMKIKDSTASISAVVFNSSAAKLGAYNLKKGQSAEFSGKIEEYNGYLEILPSRIVVK